MSEGLARAIISLATGFAKGDANAVKGIVDPQTRAIVDELLASGGWEEGTGKLEGVRVVYVSAEALESEEPSSADIALAFQEPGAAYVLTFRATPSGGNWVFASTPSTGDTKPRANAWDNLTEAQYAGTATPALPEGMQLSEEDLEKAMEMLSPEQRQQVEEAIRQNPDIIKRTPGGPVRIPNPGGG